jgi:hypothetical protein
MAAGSRWRGEPLAGRLYDYCGAGWAAVYPLRWEGHFAIDVYDPYGWGAWGVFASQRGREPRRGTTDRGFHERGGYCVAAYPRYSIREHLKKPEVRAVMGEIMGKGAGDIALKPTLNIGTLHG